MEIRHAQQCRPVLRPRWVATVLAALLALTGVTAATGAGAAPTPKPEASISVNGQSPGRQFDGVGALSAGASSRLLFDYPEPERSQILDYLFKPGYGASMQVWKAEIGGDTDSTTGAEPSHSRIRGQVDCNLGYEWWLMKEAKKRNPDIKLAGLEWGAPGYFQGGFWSQDNIEYIQSWLGCAKQHGLEIDYIGGWNESGFDKEWFKKLDRALAKSHPEVKIVAADEYESWDVVPELRRDPEFAKAVDIVGSHDPCEARTLYQHCPSPDDAKALRKPLWDSETSSEAHDVGGGPLARSINRDYIDGKMTGHMYWSPVSAWYANFPIADTGAMLADQPWSGHYKVGSSIWSLAHTAQFTKPGWRYLDEGSGYLPNGASHVSLRSQDTGDYATVVETMDASRPITTRVSVSGGLSGGRAQLWASNLASPQSEDDFVHVRDVNPVDGSYEVTLQPGHVYTLATTPGHKGEATGRSGAGEQFPLPFQENFDGYQKGQLARFFSDTDGGFQAEQCQAGRAGMCYQQMVPRQPIRWHERGGMPATVVGDPQWFGDYQVSTDAMLPEAGQVELWGRVESKQPGTISGYRLRVGTDGKWQLLSQQAQNPKSDSAGSPTPRAAEKELASGNAPFTVDKWQNVSLRFRGDQITVMIGGNEVATVRNAEHTGGQVGLSVNGWQHAQFDNVSVVRTGPSPSFVPQEQISARASSAHTSNYKGYTYGPERAVDDRPDTLWHSEFSPPSLLPESITLDLGRKRDITGLAYSPRLDETRGRITEYNAYVSNDGKNFTKVASGSWPADTATRTIDWPQRSARYVRLEAVNGSGGAASAGELRVMKSER